MKIKKGLVISICLAAVAVFPCCTSQRVMTGKAKTLPIESVTQQYRFTELKRPSTEDPALKVLIERRTLAKRATEREFYTKRSLTIAGWLFSLGLSGGLVIVGLGQIEEGKVVLGRDMLSVGLLFTPTAYLIAQRKGKPEWEKTVETVAGPLEPYRNCNLQVEIEGTTYAKTFTTDGQGQVELDVSTLLSFREKGKEVRLRLSIPETPKAVKIVSIPGSLLEVPH